MMQFLLRVGLDIAILLALFFIFWKMILPKFRTPEQMKPLEDRMKAVGSSLFTRINERLKSWRTIILAYLGTLFLVLPDLLQQFVSVEWTRIVDAATAQKIGVVLYVLSIITKLQATFGRVGDPPAALPVNTPGTAVTADDVINKMTTPAAKAFMATTARDATVAVAVKVINGGPNVVG